MIVSFSKSFEDKRDLDVFFLIYKRNIYRCSQCFDYQRNCTYFVILIKRDYNAVMSTFDFDIKSIHTRDVVVNTTEQTQIKWNIFKSNACMYFEGFQELTLDDIINNEYIFFDNSRIFIDPKSNITYDEIKSLMDFKINYIQSNLKLSEVF